MNGEPVRLGLGDSLIAIGMWVRPYCVRVSYTVLQQRTAHLCCTWVSPEARPTFTPPDILPGQPCTLRIGDTGPESGWVVSNVEHRIYSPKTAATTFYHAPGHAPHRVDLNDDQVTACIDLVEPLMYAQFLEDNARAREAKSDAHDH